MGQCARFRASTEGLKGSSARKPIITARMAVGPSRIEEKNVSPGCNARLLPSPFHLAVLSKAFINPPRPRARPRSVRHPPKFPRSIPMCFLGVLEERRSGWKNGKCIEILPFPHDKNLGASREQMRVRNVYEKKNSAGRYFCVGESRWETRCGDSEFKLLWGAVEMLFVKLQIGSRVSYRKSHCCHFLPPPSSPICKSFCLLHGRLFEQVMHFPPPNVLLSQL